jgi:hypothetical protein
MPEFDIPEITGLESLEAAREEIEKLQKRYPGAIFAIGGVDEYSVFALNWDQIGPTLCGLLPGMDFDAEIERVDPPQDFQEPRREANLG